MTTTIVIASYGKHPLVYGRPHPTEKSSAGHKLAYRSPPPGASQASRTYMHLGGHVYNWDNCNFGVGVST